MHVQSRLTPRSRGLLLNSLRQHISIAHGHHLVSGRGCRRIDQGSTEGAAALHRYNNTAELRSLAFCEPSWRGKHHIGQVTMFEPVLIPVEIADQDLPFDRFDHPRRVVPQSALVVDRGSSRPTRERKVGRLTGPPRRVGS